MAREPDVLILGGGIIGLSCALVLAERGLTVTVLERGEFGAEASWAGAGIIPPGNPEFAATPLDRLRSYGSAHFEAWSGALRELSGIDNEYHRCGGVEFLTAEEVEAYLPLWQSEHLDVRRLLSPPAGLVAPPDTTPYELADFAQVRNPRHLRALVVACGRRGVTLRPHTAVTGWEMSRGEVRGVRIRDGDPCRAGQYVVASGAWADELLRPLGVECGVRPVRGQIVLFRPPQPLFHAVLLVGKRYLVPRRDGRVLVGSTEEPEAGFAKATTRDGVEGLRDFAVRLVPALGEAPIEDAWCGLRPGSADGLPTIATAPGHPTVHAAVGHFRAGVQLSLGTARLVESLVTGAPGPIDPAGFGFGRESNARARPAFRS